MGKKRKHVDLLEKCSFEQPEKKKPKFTSEQEKRYENCPSIEHNIEIDHSTKSVNLLENNIERHYLSGSDKLSNEKKKKHKHKTNDSFDQDIDNNQKHKCKKKKHKDITNDSFEQDISNTKKNKHKKKKHKDITNEAFEEDIQIKKEQRHEKKKHKDIINDAFEGGIQIKKKQKHKKKKHKDITNEAFEEDIQIKKKQRHKKKKHKDIINDAFEGDIQIKKKQKHKKKKHKNKANDSFEHNMKIETRYQHTTPKNCMEEDDNANSLLGVKDCITTDTVDSENNIIIEKNIKKKKKKKHKRKVEDHVDNDGLDDMCDITLKVEEIFNDDKYGNLNALLDESVSHIVNQENVQNENDFNDETITEHNNDNVKKKKKLKNRENCNGDISLTSIKEKEKSNVKGEKVIVDSVNVTGFQTNKELIGNRNVFEGEQLLNEHEKYDQQIEHKTVSKLVQLSERLLPREESEVGKLLHFNISQSRSEKMQEELISQGMCVRTGRWSKEEEKILKENWEMYLQIYHPPFDPSLLLCGLSKTSLKLKKEVTDFEKMTNFGEYLACGIDRNLRSVKYKGQDLVQQHLKRGPFTDSEIQHLKELHDEYGNDWTEISRIMGRVRHNVKAKWQDIIHHEKTGHWTKDEDDLLKEAVENVRKENPTELNLPWSKIMLAVPGRNQNQVQKRWKLILNADNSDQRQKVLHADKAKLITRLNEMLEDGSCPHDDRLINWQQISHHLGYPNSYYATNLWRLIKMSIKQKTDSCNFEDMHEIVKIAFKVKVKNGNWVC